jgi:hypothetical protein
MKKWLILAVAICSCWVFTSCSAPSDQEEAPDTESSPSTTTTGESTPLSSSQTWEIVLENNHFAVFQVDSKGNFEAPAWIVNTPTGSSYAVWMKDGRMSGTEVNFQTEASYHDGTGTNTGNGSGTLNTPFPEATSAEGEWSFTIEDSLGTRSLKYAWIATRLVSMPPPTAKPGPQVKDEGTEFEQFTRLPFDIENVASVGPIGGFGGTNTRSNPYLGRPYGTERHFISHKTPGKPYNVYAPATTYIYSVRKSMVGHYGFNFKMYENSEFRLDHIHVIDPGLKSKIVAQLGEGWQETNAFEILPFALLVREGDILGQTGVYADSWNWDWLVVDRNRHEGIIVPEHYWSDIFAYSRSVYELCTDEVKEHLRSLAGNPGEPQKGEPILGQFGSDVAGTLSGTWFYDVTNDPRWGPKIAVFRRYHMDSSKVEIKLAIPELDVYGVWIISPGEPGNINPEPENVTPESGIVYYILDGGTYYTEELGLMVVRVNADSTITIETQRDQFDPEDFSDFTGSELTLSR